MDFEKNEEKLRDFLEPLRKQKPPAKIMEGYEKEVLQKIQAAEGPSFGFLPVLCFAFVLAGALGFWFLVMRPAGHVEPKPVKVIQEIEVEVQKLTSSRPERSEAERSRNDEISPLPSVGRNDGSETSDYITQSEEELLEAMSEDLFILEMLGEDEGVLGDFERLESDLDLWAGISPVVGA